MSQKKPNWLQKPNVSWRWAIAAAGTWFALLLAFARTDLSTDFEYKVAHPIDFQIREALGKSPEMDPRVKAFGIDDSTVSWLGSPDPSIELWAKLIMSMAARKPKAIIIDGMFTIPGIPEGREDASLKAIAELEAAEPPVIVGSFVAPKKLKYREPLPTDTSQYHIPKMIVRSADNMKGLEDLAKEIVLPEARSPYQYGPNPILRKAFRNIGDISYNGDGMVSPFLRFNDEYAVPHFIFLAEPRPKFFNGRIHIAGQEVPTFPDGRIPLNFSTFEYFLKVTKPLRINLERATAGEPALGIEEGDYVYILPGFFTGSTDFKMTPFGEMPAGYAHMVLLNSVLTNNWLRPVWIREILIAVGCALGSVVASAFGPIGIGAGLFAGLLGWFSFVIYLFSYESIMLPWLYPTLGYLAVLITVFVEKSRMAEKKAQFIHHALDGMISPKRLSVLARNPQSLNFEARERVVTIMFIDVVGFSLMAENQLPRIAFDHLKNVLSDIIATVHRHGGIVNKNLGDGLLCFFGYSIENDESTFDHAEKAIECAVEIQRENLPKTLLAHSREEPVYPLRIGVNTSSVFIGNIGTDERLDFTIVGNGVNFAKRLESNCETHCVLMGAATRELVASMGLDQRGLKKQYIHIKHHVDMVEAYSYDPFFAEPDLRQKAIEAHISSTNLAKEEERWLVKNPEAINVSTNVGIGRLVDFGTIGFNLVLPALIVDNSSIKVQLNSADGSLKRDLEGLDLGTIDMEVALAYEHEEGYLHGLKFKNLNDNMIGMLLQILSKYVESEDVLNRPQLRKIG